MYNILKLNKISPLINDIFNENYSCTDTATNPHGILLRSFNMADYEVGSNLVAIARAGAGVNNIPIDKMAEKGIVVFNTPGANANAVKELVLCAMLLASRDIIAGCRWVNSLSCDVAKTTEKNKSSFGGTEIFGKTLGVIGLGAIGSLVANSCVALGMKVIGYDPVLTESAKNKLHKSIELVTLEELYERSNIITIHVPLLDSTKNMINKCALDKMQDNVIIINMSRAALVNIADLKEGIASKKVHRYVVDFPEENVLGCEGIIVIPHLGASTEEAEDNCAVMAANQIIDYLENGNITNSVNYPNVYKDKKSNVRTCILFKGSLPIFPQLEGDKVMVSNGNFGYAIIDSERTIDIPACENILKVRVL